MSDHGLADQVADLSEAVSDLARDVAYIKGGIRVIGIGLGIAATVAGGVIGAMLVTGGRP